MWTRRRFLKTLSAVPLAGLTGSVPLVWTAQRAMAADGELRFKDGAHNDFGDWWADVRV